MSFYLGVIIFQKIIFWEVDPWWECICHCFLEWVGGFIVLMV